MSTLLQGRSLIPHRTSSAANLRQLRTPRHLVSPRIATCVKSQAASTTQTQQQASEKARQEPTATQDTTHVPIETNEPTDPAHVTNGSGPKGAGMEVDSVLAKELSENGTLRRRSYYGDQHSGRVTASIVIHSVMMPKCSHGCRFPKYKTYKNHMYNRAKV